MQYSRLQTRFLFAMVKFCQDEGSILVEIPSAYSKTEVTNYFNRTGLSSSAQFWTGLKYNDTTLSFIWNATATQITPTSFSDWYKDSTNSPVNQLWVSQTYSKKILNLNFWNRLTAHYKNLWYVKFNLFRF